MSILYNALKKSEQERRIKESAREKVTDKAFVENLKTWEEEQRQAIHARIRARKPYVVSPQKQEVAKQRVFLFAVLAVFFIVGAVFIYLSMRASDAYIQKTVFESQASFPQETIVDIVAVTPAWDIERELKIGDFAEPAVVAEIAPASSMPDSFLGSQEVIEEASIVTSEPVIVAPDFVCSGIIIDSYGRSCIINGEILYEGDSIAGAYVTAIANDRVSLSYQGVDLDVLLFS